MDAAPTIAAGVAGRVVICVGATGGIGKAVVNFLARCGIRIFAVDLGKMALDPLVRRLPGTGHEWLASDLGDAKIAESVACIAENKVGPVHALTYLAGILRRHPIDAVTVADWDWHMMNNLRPTFLAARGFCRVLKQDDRQGSVTTFTSRAWWTGGHESATAYAASKGGIVSASRTLARTYVPYGIRVNTVALRAIDTSMLRKDLLDGAIERVAEAIPLRRLGQPDEVATGAVRLTSDNARFIIGTVLNVSGGWLAY